MVVTKKEYENAYSEISKKCKKLEKENHLLKRRIMLIGNLSEKMNTANWKIAGLMSFDYLQNCGKCKHCTIPNFDEINIPKCPQCGSDKAKLCAPNNPNNNQVMCENGHRYNISPFCDREDIALHQRTIENRIKQVK